MDYEVPETPIATPEKQGIGSLLGAPSSHRAAPNRLTLRPSLIQLAAKGELRKLAAALEEGVDDIDAVSPNGSTPLVLAAKYGHVDAVKLLLSHGATSYKEALVAALESKNQEIIALLSKIASSSGA
jgi:ankyrin repeat protein